MKNIAAKEFKNFNPVMLPLFGTLLGNDYIERRALSTFYKQVSVGRGAGGPNLMKRRIYAIIQWLRNETPESAIKKILMHIKKSRREELLKNLEIAMSGYKNELCESYVFFGLHDVTESTTTEDKTNLIDFGRLNLEKYDDDTTEISEDSDEDDYDSDIQSIVDETNDAFENGENSQTIDEFPEWFRFRFMRGEMSRFFVNLFSLHLYISTPQIEDYNLPDSNLIAKDILLFMFALIHHPKTSVLNYLTRNLRGHSVVYHKFEPNPLTIKDIVYDPTVQKNSVLFKHVFRNFENSDKFLTELKKLPENFHLYLTSIYYWGLSSKQANVAHIQSIILCLVYITSQVCGSNFTSAEIPKAERISLRKRFHSYFSVSDKVKSRHGTTTYSVLYPLAEFQSVIFNLNNLNTLLNYPQPKVNIQEFFNGIFIYNMYMNLKGRHDINHYISNYFCENSPKLLYYYNSLYNFIKEFVPTLLLQNIKNRMTPKVVGASKSRSKPRRKKMKSVSSADDIGDGDKVVAYGHDDSDSDFNDVNNKFSVLLRI